MKNIFISVMAFFISLFSSIGGLFGSGAPTGANSPEWREMVLNNYQEFISEVDGDNNKIPMIVHTDQHGAIKADSEFYKYIDSIVDWTKISKIINLGDTVELIFNNTQLVEYIKATECLPTEKRIEVIGNHDRFFVPTFVGPMIDSFYFPTENSTRSADNKAFTVKDEQFNVRYLAIDTKVFPWNYEDGVLLTDQADFIIDELSANDPSDIILLAHPYLFKDAIIRRSGAVFTGSEYFIGGETKGADVKQSFIDMLTARRNKTAGVLIDSKGVEHPYDFTACESDFLMALHGHHHSEGYETKNDVTEFLFQSMTKDNAQNTEPDCFYFAYIDRAANTFKCWKNVEGYDAWEFTFG